MSEHYRLKRIYKFLNNIYIKTLSFFMLSCLFILTFFSLSFTAYMKLDKGEKTFFLKDKDFLSIGIFILIIFFLSFYYKVVQKYSEKRLFNVIMILSFLISFVFVIIFNVEIRADQKQIFLLASSMQSQDYSIFNEGSYINQYPFQLGLVLFNEFLMFFFKDATVFIFRLLNCFGIVAIVYALHELSFLIFNSKKVLYVFDALIILFSPLFYYATFYYGNILSLAFSLLAMMYQLYYFKKKKSWTYLILSVLFITLAIMLKNNSMIFLVAMLLQHLFYLDDKLKRKLVVIAVTMISVLAMQQSVKSFYEMRADVNIGNGIPKTAWLAMGLQEGKRAPGWYNRYSVDLYIQNDNDSEKTSQESLSSIKNSINTFVEQPSYALRFFSKKTVSQWNNPSFQSFWILTFPLERGLQHELADDEAILRKIQENFLDGYELLIYGMAFLCFFLKRREKDIIFYQLGLVFIGGFVFHLFWEAKGQYTFGYFILLIPYAAYGAQICLEKIASLPIWKNIHNSSIF